MTACWVATSSGYVPPGATVGVVHELYGATHVARAQHDGNWIPGVLIASSGQCFVTSNGVQHLKHQYQVLCNAGETWKQMHEDLLMPRDALPVGYTEQDGEQYVGRVLIKDVTVPGVVLKRDRRCYVFYDDTVTRHSEFELLTVPMEVQYDMRVITVEAPIIDLTTENDDDHPYERPNVWISAPSIDLTTESDDESPTVVQARSNVPVSSVSQTVHARRTFESRSRQTRGTRVNKKQTRTSTLPPPQPPPVATNVPPGSASWVASSKGKVPPGAMSGGKNHLGAIYVARALHENATVPGKLIPNYGQCYIAWLGQEVRKLEYEVLCDATAGWQRMSSQSAIPATAVQGGVSADGSTIFYIGRIAHGSSITCGKVDGVTKKCCVLYGGFEHTYDEYDLLVTGDPIPASRVPMSPTRPEEDFKLVPLSTTDADYVAVSQRMQSTIQTHPGVTISSYQIIKVERVWNKIVYKRFIQFRERVMYENNKIANEKELFHGSSKCQEIAKSGFDERHSSTGGMFGAGLYFAEHSSKSNQYARGTPRQMLLCRVILGKVKEHTTAYNTYAHAPPGHHSVKGTPGGGLNYPEYIVYRGEQALPKFLITYATT